MERNVIRLAAFAALCVAIAWLSFLFVKGGVPCEGEKGEVPSVRLANRTIVVPLSGNSHEAALPPLLSRRGTAAFVLVVAGHVTGEVRRRAARCGARVIGVMPPHGIVVEADAAALARLRADGAFAAVEALTAADRMSAALKSILAEMGDDDPVAVTVVPLGVGDSAEIARHLAANGVSPEEV